MFGKSLKSLLEAKFFKTRFAVSLATASSIYVESTVALPSYFCVLLEVSRKFDQLRVYYGHMF